MKTAVLLLVTLWAGSAALSQGEPDEAAAPSAVRAVLVGSSGAPLDVRIDGELVADRLAPGEAGPYASVAAGPAALVVAPSPERGEGGGAGASDAAAEDPAAATSLGDVEFESGTYHTLLVTDPYAGGGDEAPFVLLQDHFAALPPAGAASLRAVHARAGSGRLSLLVRRRDPDEAANDDPPPLEPLNGGAAGVLAELDFLHASAHVVLPAGRYRVWWMAEGEDPSAGAALEVELRQAASYTLIALPAGDAAPPALLLLDAGTPVPQGPGSR